MSARKDENEDNLRGESKDDSHNTAPETKMAPSIEPKAGPRAPPSMPGGGPARDLQNSKALVEKLRKEKKGEPAIINRSLSKHDAEISDFSEDFVEDDDYIKFPRIPVPLAEESLADEKRLAGESEGLAFQGRSGTWDSDSDERELRELDAEVRSQNQPFVSYRDRKKRATGDVRSNDNDASPGRSAGVPVAPLPDEAKGVTDAPGGGRGESILSVFNTPQYEVSPQVKDRESFMRQAGGTGGSKEVIGKKLKNAHNFSVVAHEHGFMPVSARRSYKGTLRDGGATPSVQNGAADEGEFFETDKVYCTILRDRFSSKRYPEYQLVLDSTQRPLLLAKKMSGNKTSNYHIFDLSRGRVALKNGAEFDKKSGNYMGKLRANDLGGTEYVLFGNANSCSNSKSAVNNYLPEKMDANEVDENDVKRELAAISYERSNMLSQLRAGSQPRKLSVVLPPLDAEAVPVPNTYLLKDKTKYGLDKCIRDPVDAVARECYVLESKEPIYENGNYRLNFNGRVSLPSVKNFQLVTPDHKNDVICQFGKVGDDTFHLDFKRPVTAFQAFALALSQFNL